MQLYHGLCIRLEWRESNLLSTPPLNSLGVAHLTALDLDPISLVREAGQAGFSSVGLRLNPATAGGIAYPITAGTEALKRLKATMQAEAVSLYEIEFIQLSPEVMVSSFEPMLESGAELGAVCLSVSGDDADFARLTDHYAALCCLAKGYGLRVDLEFMRWRQVATLEQAIAVVVASGQANAGVLLDALHFFRSGGEPSAITQTDLKHLHALQLSDAPLLSPAEDLIIPEARAGRLLPGCGGLPLAELLSVLPADIHLSVETPSLHIHRDERLKQAFSATQSWLEQAHWQSIPCSTNARDYRSRKPADLSI